jgi:DNA-binding NtrC family response regulator
MVEFAAGGVEKEEKKPMKARILVIDNEPRWLQFARDDLGMTFDVDVATDLETALNKLAVATEPYALIIASSRWSKVLKEISKRYPEKPIVVVTGQPTTSEAINMYRLGALDYFPKDLRREVVSEKIREAISKPVKNR